MTAAIILAAGGSSRLGQPKQNLIFKGQTLLANAVNTCLHANCEPVLVVLGANSEQIEPIHGCTMLYNPEWKQGMASSIKLAVQRLSRYPSVKRIIIMLCDQPFVSVELLNDLMEKQQETGHPIVACAYDGTRGVPALFDREVFEELLKLQGQQGARSIIEIHADKTATIPFEKGSIDIDTYRDYEQLISELY